ncbi:hypothetical protein BLSTO_03732 [Blastocystis sp. subtype 1]
MCTACSGLICIKMTVVGQGRVATPKFESSIDVNLGGRPSFLLQKGMRLAIVVILTLIYCTQALYFFLEHDKPFCIVEKPTEGLPIVYKYRNYDLFMYKPDYDKSDDLNAKLYVISPLGTKYMETNAKDSGKLVFTPYESGMYRICAELSRPLPDEFWEYGNPLRFYFEVEHGIKQLNVTKLAKVKDINEVDKTVSSLVGVLKEMTQELKYQNTKEKEIRDEDDSDNRMIFIWSMLEVFVMILVAVIQVLSIRRYLKQKQVI